MNKLLMNISVSVLTFTSVSYGSDDDLGTPHEVGSTSNSTTATALSSERSPEPKMPTRDGFQRFIITDDTTRDELIPELRRVESLVIIIQKNVIVYLKNLACILTADAAHPVKPRSEVVEQKVIEVVSLLQASKDKIAELESEKEALESLIQSSKDRITLLEAENKKLEKTLRQWKYGVIVSVVVLAFIYQNVLNYGYDFLSILVNSLNSFESN